MGAPQKPDQPGTTIGDSERGVDKPARAASTQDRSTGGRPVRRRSREPQLTPEQRRQAEIAEIFTEADPQGKETSRQANPRHLGEKVVGGHVEQPKSGRPPRSQAEPIQTRVGKLAHQHAEDIIGDERVLPRNLLGSNEGDRIRIYLRDDDSSIGKPGKFPDRVDVKNRIVYEIKPRSPYGQREGPPQAKNYARLLNEAGNVEVWEYRVAYYEPNEAIDFLSKKYELLPAEVDEYREAMRRSEAKQAARVRQKSTKEGGKPRSDPESGGTPRTTAAESESKTESRGTTRTAKGETESKTKSRGTSRVAKGDPADERAVKSRGLARKAEPEAERGHTGATKSRRRGPRPGMRGHALVGALFSTVISTLGMLALRKFQEDYLKDLSAMPLPPLDPRDTQTYLSDPATKAGANVLDLLGRDWSAVGVDLRQASDKAFAETAAEQNQLLVADLRPVPERLDDLAALTEAVGGIATELETILTNIDAILALERQLEETAKHAGALEMYVRTVAPAGIVLGVVAFGPDELDQIANFFLHIKVGSRMVPVRLRALRQVIAPLEDEWTQAASELSRAQLGLALDAAAREVEAQGAPKTLTVPGLGVEDPRGIR